ncbi:metal-sensing transcriptional repressor [Tumebacillus sp. ITR2]|uniref:Metal-sensing transcriptional repressor n=1 Tax=Tumebacillus amylolyticus TaxID=2801339 RepID=A0ABS1J5T2_9BACL|nr:metal-sensing transcriptional repressor [Tumebacillus amylolyticus]MBL0385560.1 metal-sensing transcriptional repressor [Tumebacillus amylolyticus]
MHEHSHSHEHKHRKKVVNRLARIEGHVRAIKEMADSDRDCSDILLQIAAVRKALDNTAKVILQDHIESCVAHAMTHGEEGQVLEDLRKALEHFIR